MPEVVSSLLVGRYQLDEMIGRGGMGEVWRGRDLQAGRPVAVKMLVSQAAEVGGRERFAREVHAVARIVHPNVVTVLDVGEQAGQPFLVMELLTGRSLAAELAERGRYAVAEACDLMSQAAAGLEAAHRVGVVHRDVKPANLHRTAQGVLKVVDFGVAHVSSEAARLTMVGTVVGTAAYLAPEQIAGRGGEPASDLYALGCVLYELLCGQPPFVGPVPQLMYQHIQQPPVPPSRHRADIPPELEGLIMALLAKEPGARPASAGVVRQVLDAVVRSAATGGGRRPGLSMPPAPPARGGDTALLDAPPVGLPPTPPSLTLPAPAPPSRGRRPLVQVVVAVAAVVAVASVAVALSTGSGESPPSAAPSVAASEQATTTPPATSESATSEPATAPSTPPPSPEGWLADLDRAVLAQQAQGGIDPDLVHSIREKIQKALSEDKGKGNRAPKQIRDLRRDLTDAQRKGKIAAGGPLSTFLNASGLSGDGGDDEDE
ncbi:hypothetical protein Pth03_38480 [Planotetraspora thailandica]|uniref:non-specific serine/threonine protein kinase n=1 Tax=Planotetraspora thailandica TaxID=487172 RepID=A0A8J3XWJ7_9ACTN|nr:serine/threonine-protein kinase [Planotetraspora thailandica]GII55459.1 hypothetical protein Pth03_38480 [Planotetraspora thailandica]